MSNKEQEYAKSTFNDVANKYDETLNHLEKRVLRGSGTHALDILANALSV